MNNRPNLIKRNVPQFLVSRTFGLGPWFMIPAQLALTCLGTSLQAVDLDPELIGRWPGYSRGPAQGIAVSANFAYVAAGSLQVIDVSNPSAPRRVGGVNGSTMRKVKLSGQFAYVAEYDALHVIDVSDPARPRRVGGLDVSAEIQNLAVWDHNACMVVPTAEGIVQLQIVDLNNLASPRVVGSINSTGQAWDIAVHGAHAFVADGRSGLQVLDFRDPTKLQRVGSYQREGTSVSAVGVADNYVYVGEFPSNLQVIDVGDPGNPRPLGRCNLAGYPYAIELSGSHAFVATATNVAGIQRTTVEIIDVSDPGLPRSIGGFGAQDGVVGVAVSGVNLYATYYGALQVIDIGNPAAPKRVAAFRTDGVVDHVGVLGRYAYLAESYEASDGGSGLRVIDIFDPRQPRDVGEIDLGTEIFHDRSQIEQLTLSGNFASLIERRSDWRFDVPGSRSMAHLIDIRNPTDPKRLAAIEVSNESAAVCLSGEFAYLLEGWNDEPQSRFARWRSRLTVLDLSEPAHPQRLGAFETTMVTYGMAVSGDFVFLTGTDESPARRENVFIVLNVSNPANPRKVNQLNFEDWIGGVTLSGGYAYFPAGGGLHAIDIRDPANPRNGATFPYLSGYAHQLGFATASGHYGFSTLSGSFGNPPTIIAVDLSDPRNLKGAGAYIPDGTLSAVTALSNLVYVASGKNGIEIVDFEKPANPQRFSAFSSNWRARAVAGSGGFASLLEEDPDGGLQRLAIIDVNHLARPRLLRTVGLPQAGFSHGISASDTYACVIATPLDSTKQQGRLILFDIHNPADPQLVGTLDTPGWLSSVAVSGDQAYVVETGGSSSDVYANLVGFNLSDPGSPRKVGTCERREWGGPLAVSAPYAYLPTQDGLEVIDLSDPTHPARLGRCQTPGNQSPAASAVAIWDHHAYLAAGGGWSARKGRLEVIDVRDPAHPRWVGGHDTISATKLAVFGQYAYLGGNGGLEVFDVREPANPRRVGANSVVGSGGYNLAIQEGKVLAPDYNEGLVILNPFSALRFRSTLLKDNGSIQLNLSGLNGQRARLQRSANLRDWQNVRTITLSEDGLGSVAETGGPSGFYRAVEEKGP